MTDRLTDTDLPRIRKAIEGYRDALKSYLDSELGKKHILGNFDGLHDLDDALREPRMIPGLQDLAAQKREPTTILTSSTLPRDLRKALANVWRLAPAIDREADRLILFDAIDEVLELSGASDDESFLQNLPSTYPNHCAT